MNKTSITQLSKAFNGNPVIIPLLGYLGGNKDYQRAKAPIERSWTLSDYKGLNEEQVEEHIRRGGWIGLRIPSGYILVDLDNPDIGEWLRKLINKLDLKADCIKTPNGWQFIFRDTGQVKNQQVKMLTKGMLTVDYRLAGKGYTVLPTTNTEGREWINLSLDGISPLPTWLEPLRQAKEEDTIQIPIRVGERNDILFRHCCRLRDYSQDEEEIREVMRWVNTYLTEEPLGDQELEKLIEKREGYDYTPEKTGSEEERQKQTQADRLYLIGLEADIFLDQNGIAWATFQQGDHYETRQLRKKSFRAWLSDTYKEREGKVLTNIQARESAIDALEGEARKKPKQKIYTRIAHIGDKIYLDLANDNWEIVEISQDGWRVIEGNKDIKFKRTEGMEALPIPEDGDLSSIAKYLNIEDKDLILLLSFIVGCYCEGPYPILVLQGEQGSGKSTLTRMIKNLIDPNTANLKILPDNERDLMVIAVNNYLLTFDNLAGISPKVGDGLSRLATGGGMSLRALYTDDEEMILEAKRPIILNGIDVGIERHDLLDRAILIQLPRLREGGRMDEATFWKGYYQDRPKILGGLLTVISTGLRNLPNTKVERLPRMADFTKWVVSCEPALCWKEGEFLEAYRENREEIVENVLEADPIAGGLQKLLEEEDLWTGTISELYQRLKEIISDEYYFKKNIPSPKSLGKRLRRSVTFLRQEGIEIEFSRTNRNKTIYIKRLKPSKTVES